MFFGLSTLVLVLVLVAIIGGTTAIGLVVGRKATQSRSTREPVGVVQGTLLGFLGLLLAFGLSMAVGRYEGRRTLVVQEANDIGTTYLRAQMLPEPARTTSLDLLRTYADTAIDLARQVPGNHRFNAAMATMSQLQARLWAAAGDAVRDEPTGTAPRLYVESLNAMIDSHGERVSSLNNRVPSTVMLLQVVGSAIALGMLALYLSLLGRGVVTSVTAAVVVVLILFVAFDLDRPYRGFISVPDAPLVTTRAAMDVPPAATGP